MAQDNLPLSSTSILAQQFDSGSSESRNRGKTETPGVACAPRTRPPRSGAQAQATKTTGRQADNGVSARPPRSGAQA